MKALVLLAVLVPGSLALAQDMVFEGTWKTTNRKLDGTMTCVITPLTKNEWQGRFYGIWQGVDFDYKVTFTGPKDDLRGTATIDGAHYDWLARIDGDRFRANFSGDRYTGSFELKRKAVAPVARSAAARAIPSR